MMQEQDRRFPWIQLVIVGIAILIFSSTLGYPRIKLL